MPPNSLTAPEPRPSADERDARTAELRRRAEGRGVWIGLGWTGICCALELIGWGGRPVLRVMLIGLFALLLLAAVGGTLGLVWHRYRDATERLFRSLIAAFVVFMVSFPLTTLPRSWALTRARDRAEPLIAAIRAYESRRGTAPATLDLLVPEFLSELPSIGFFGAPKFKYSLHAPRPGESPTWDLHIDAGTLFLGSVLVYEPRGNGGGWREDRW